MLKPTIDCAVDIRAVKPLIWSASSLTTQWLDSWLLEIARDKVVSAAWQAGINLKQTDAHEGMTWRRKAGG